jgi:hypothetical protein
VLAARCTRRVRELDPELAGGYRVVGVARDEHGCLVDRRLIGDWTVGLSAGVCRLNAAVRPLAGAAGSADPARRNRRVPRGVWAGISHWSLQIRRARVRWDRSNAAVHGPNTMNYNLGFFSARPTLDSIAWKATTRIRTCVAAYSELLQISSDFQTEIPV